MMELVDEAERAIAQHPRAPLAQRVNVLPVDPHLCPVVGAIQPAENLQQRRLAGAGRADDCEPLAASDSEVHAPQHLEQ